MLTECNGIPMSIDEALLPDRISTLIDLHNTMYHFVGENYKITDARGVDDGAKMIYVNPKDNISKRRFKDAKRYVREHKVMDATIWFNEGCNHLVS